jgi:hypothetical protein
MRINNPFYAIDGAIVGCYGGVKGIFEGIDYAWITHHGFIWRPFLYSIFMGGLAGLF